jgi:hypothetical protein
MIGYKQMAKQASFLLPAARRAINGDGNGNGGDTITDIDADDDANVDAAMVMGVDARTKAADALNGKTPAVGSK